ncbi:hypothetical protein HAZT_HAZT011513 [Hyalella azteca]|uniref:Acyl-coenzyme A thioesterase 1 n=1 Tax=Hyalella azteca TaxID=294128 RepID=A0A6A0GTG8_HYAAZ|nr:acyl-coenzyme A thioesterase 1 [Hyalella azteca]KAA0187832.1 hypothetical protein HAZT_HAZT011513 [Hyalella azteca]
MTTIDLASADDWSPQLARTAAPAIEVRPLRCLLDEEVRVVVSGLEPDQVYTLQSSVTDCKGVPFTAVAHYRSDCHGVIDLTRTPSIGGHFTGEFPMGLFASILPGSTKLKDPRFSFHDVTKPAVFDLTVYKGACGHHLMLMNLESMSLEPVCETRHERHLMGEGCSRIPVRYKTVRGVLHLPKGDGPFPGVVDMFGSAGGLMEHRASLLAARGVAALALAFFNYEDLPSNMDSLDLEYFAEAVEYLLSRDEVSKEGVGAIGTSKGGDIVLDMAVAIPEVRVAVVINGCCYSAETSTRRRGKPIRTPMAIDPARMRIQRDLRVDLSAIVDFSENAGADLIPVEKIKGDILWIVGMDDRNWLSENFADLAYERYSKYRSDDLHKFTVVKYPGAGHLIEPPYVPFCEVSYHRLIMGSMVWGGRPVGHTSAQVDSWRRMIALFKAKLLPPSACLASKL